MGLIKYIGAIVSSRVKNKKGKSEKDMEGEISFNKEHGLICNVCEKEMPLVNGGYNGVPTLCENCKIKENE